MSSHSRSKVVSEIRNDSRAGAVGFDPSAPAVFHAATFSAWSAITAAWSEINPASIRAASSRNGAAAGVLPVPESLTTHVQMIGGSAYFRFGQATRAGPMAAPTTDSPGKAA